MAKELGDCYEIHAKAILFEMHPGLLCHGTVHHPEIGWHGHCWIEVKDSLVIDNSNGNEAELPRELYYMLGQVKDVTRYTSKEARAKVLEFETWGPWEESNGNHPT